MGASFVTPEKPYGAKIAVSTLWLALLVAYLVANALYFRRRHYDLIAHRSPIWTSILMVVIWINCVTGFGIEIWAPHAGCEYDWIYVIQSISFVAIFSLAIWKCLQVVCQFEMQRMRLSVQLYDELNADALAHSDGTENHTLIPPPQLQSSADQSKPLIVGGGGGGGNGDMGTSSTPKHGAVLPLPTSAPASAAASSAAVAAVATGDGGVQLHDDDDLRHGLITAPTFVQRHLDVLTSRKLLACFILYSCIDGILGAAGVSMSTPPVDVCYGTSQALIYFEVPLAFILFWLALKVREVQDGFFITEELKLQGLIAIYQSLFIAAQAVAKPDSLNSLLGHVNILLVLTALWYVTFIKPLRATYREDRKREFIHRTTGGGTGGAGNLSARASFGGGGTVSVIDSPFATSEIMHVPASIATFDALLASKHGRASFTRHLMLEFSVEHLIFINAIDGLHKTAAVYAATTAAAMGVSPPASGAGADGESAVTAVDPTNGGTLVPEAELARLRAYEVYEKFIAHGSSFAINASYETLKPLHAVFGPRHLYRKRIHAQITGLSTAAAAGLPKLGRRGSSSALRLIQQHKHASGSRPTSRPASRPTTPGLRPATTGGAGAGVLGGGAASKYATSGGVLLPPPPASASASSSTATVASSVDLKQPHAATATAPAGSVSLAVRPFFERPANTLASRPALAPLPEEVLKRGGSKLAFQLNPSGAVSGDYDPFDDPPPRNATYYWTIFDAAYAEVRGLLEADSYVRYVNSVLFAELIKKVVLAEQLKANPNGSGVQAPGTKSSPALQPNSPAGGAAAVPQLSSNFVSIKRSPVQSNPLTALTLSVSSNVANKTGGVATALATSIGTPKARGKSFGSPAAPGAGTTH